MPNEHTSTIAPIQNTGVSTAAGIKPAVHSTIPNAFISLCETPVQGVQS